MSASALQLGLISGASSQRGFSLRAGRARALFRVGSACECNWRVTGPGIAPHHLMILWSGRVLSVVDVGAGSLFVDGKPFYLYREIQSGRIQFGSGEILVSSAMPVGPEVCK